MPYFPPLSLVTPLLLPKVSVRKAAGAVGRASEHQRRILVSNTAHPGTAGHDATAPGDLQLKPGSSPPPAHLDLLDCRGDKAGAGAKGAHGCNERLKQYLPLHAVGGVGCQGAMETMLFSGSTEDSSKISSFPKKKAPSGEGWALLSEAKDLALQPRFSQHWGASPRQTFLL